MPSYEADALIERGAEDVWAYAADIPRHTDWMTVASARVVSGTDTAVGARGRELLLFGPFRWDVEIEVTAAEPRTIARVALGVDDPRIDLVVELILEPVDGSRTRATYRASGDGLRGRWRLLQPLLSMEGSAGVKRELSRLKANLEKQAATPDAV